MFVAQRGIRLQLSDPSVRSLHLIASVCLEWSFRVSWAGPGSAAGNCPYLIPGPTVNYIVTEFPSEAFVP